MRNGSSDAAGDLRRGGTGGKDFLRIFGKMDAGLGPPSETKSH